MSHPRPTLQAARGSVAHDLPADIGSVCAVALVEGPSDAAAVHALARRQGRDLLADGVAVVAIGGATNIGHHLEALTGMHPDLRLSGLCDADEVRAFRRAIERAGLCADPTRAQMADLGFFVCDADLEDELIRALGADVVLEVFDRNRKLDKFRLYQRQPAHREELLAEQLRGFVTNWKVSYAQLFVEALDLNLVPPPLAGLLEHLTTDR